MTRASPCHALAAALEGSAMISLKLVNIVAEPRDGDVARQPAQVKCSHDRQRSPLSTELVKSR
jgi:hypothetical protein